METTSSHLLLSGLYRGGGDTPRIRGPPERVVNREVNMQSSILRVDSSLDASREDPQARAARCRTVVELGAQSLKLHRLEPPSIRTAKHPYSIGHDVYATGAVSDETIDQTVDILRTELALKRALPALAIGTSALRDASNRRSVVERLQHEAGIPLRILSPWEEAHLLADGYLSHDTTLPACVLDIGGGSCQIVHLFSAKNLTWNSIPLGAIRLRHLMQSPSFPSELGRIFETLSFIRTSNVTATGGTVSAIAKVLGRTSFDRDDLELLEADVWKNGPPATLRPERAEVFLAGILLLDFILSRLGADGVDHAKLSVGQALLLTMSK